MNIIYTSLLSTFVSKKWYANIGTSFNQGLCDFIAFTGCLPIFNNSFIKMRSPQGKFDSFFGHSWMHMPSIATQKNKQKWFNFYSYAPFSFWVKCPCGTLEVSQTHVFNWNMTRIIDMDIHQKTHVAMTLDKMLKI